MGADYIYGPKGDQCAPTSGTDAGTDGAGGCGSVKTAHVICVTFFPGYRWGCLRAGFCI